MEVTKEKLTRMIDHSLLHPASTERELEAFCDTVNRYKFGAAYVLPANVPAAVELIDNGVTRVGTGIGFPFGAHRTEIKLYECEDAIDMGVEEIDVVINIGALKSGNYALVSNELSKIVSMASSFSVKSILEVSYLSDEEIVTGAKISCDAGVDYVKTGTGFGTRATTIHDIELIIGAIGNRAAVKAAGGIKDIDMLLRMYRIGVRRFGVSAGDRIIREFEERYGGRNVTESEPAAFT